MHGFFLFHDIEDMRRGEKVRTWAAISAGSSIIVKYTKVKTLDALDIKKIWVRWVKQLTVTACATDKV